MSFNDIQPRRGSATAAARRDSALNRVSTAGAPADALSSELQGYQTLSVKLKDKISELRRKGGVNAAQRGEVDAYISDLSSVETRLRNQLESQTKQLDQLPRTEIAQKRIALGKISKDFDRVKASVVLLVAEAGSIKVETASKSGKNSNGKNNEDIDGANVFLMGQQGGASGNGTPGGKANNLPQFQQQLQGQDVDDLIAEERERDIKKMNQDLRLVNEMFKDMAEIVEKQSPAIEQIATATEASHDRAKAGLEQVQQAAAHQGGCCIS